MRHNKKFNHLGRQQGHRKALLANMAISLVEHKRITTTLAKAKAIRVYLEPLVTKSKDNTMHSRRVVFSYLQNKEAVTELFTNIGPKVANRPGGYLRIIKIGFRQGDNADMAIIEFVDYNETLLKSSDASADGKKRRTRRGRKKAETTPTVEDATEVVEDAVEEVEKTEE